MDLRIAADSYGDPFWVLWSSFELHLQAEGRSPATLSTYRHMATALYRFLTDETRPTDPVQLGKADLEAHMAATLATRSAATACTAYAALHSWFAWMEQEEIVERSPMHRMRRPRLPEQPQRVLTADDLRRLLKACAGAGLRERRDTALIRLAVDTGLRREELARLAIEDLDLRKGLLIVKIKGGDTEITPFGARAARDLDRYLRVRARHPKASERVERSRELVHPLWLSDRGRLTASGIYHLVKARAAAADLDVAAIHPHVLRHSFAHLLKAAHASDEDVQRLGRWRDSKMVRRYGAALSQQRAWETHRRLSPGDRL